MSVHPTSYQVRLEIFEGPLDLLLHLIRTQEIDIYDIPISTITQQYLEYLDLMKNLSVAVAGEFLVMAATLIHIKSRLLLPQDSGPDDLEQPEDPRQELVERLLEHERFKKAAGLLHDRQIIESSVWGRSTDEFEDEQDELVSASLFDLVQAFHKIAERYKEKIVIRLDHEQVTLEEKLEELRSLLAIQREVRFSSFFHTQISRLQLVMTFFALLELARLSEIRLFQEAVFSDIRIVAC